MSYLSPHGLSQKQHAVVNRGLVDWWRTSDNPILGTDLRWPLAWRSRHYGPYYPPPMHVRHSVLPMILCSSCVSFFCRGMDHSVSFWMTKSQRVVNLCNFKWSKHGEMCVPPYSVISLFRGKLLTGIGRYCRLLFRVDSEWGNVVYLSIWYNLPWCQDALSQHSKYNGLEEVVGHRFPWGKGDLDAIDIVV